jgi:hypothetical protein
MEAWLMNELQLPLQPRGGGGLHSTAI